MPRTFKKKILPLTGSPAMKDHAGDGQATLVVKNGVPQLLIYSPDREVPVNRFNIKIDPENSEEIIKTTQVFSGEVKNSEFVVSAKIFPPKTKLAILRESTGLTQMELSKKSGVMLRHIQRIENYELDILNVSFKTILALSKALNVDLKEFI